MISTSNTADENAVLLDMNLEGVESLLQKNAQAMVCKFSNKFLIINDFELNW